MDVPKEGIYTIWLAGSLPDASVSPILWRIDSPPVYSYSIDAIMITQGAFHPNGSVRPPPVDAAELKLQKLNRPKKQDPPSRIPRSNYPIPN